MLVLVLMGISGVGKTTVGRVLAEQLGWEFLEGDDLHPPENVAKLRAGIPLCDDDRIPWYQALCRALDDLHARGGRAVLAVSALRAAHRSMLTEGRPGVGFVHLVGDRALVAERLRSRRDHFMPAGLLDSQLAALQPPEDAIEVAITGRPEEIAAEIRRRLGL
jgi:gluconokinase